MNKKLGFKCDICEYKYELNGINRIKDYDLIEEIIIYSPPGSVRPAALCKSCKDESKTLIKSMWPNAMA